MWCEELDWVPYDKGSNHKTQKKAIKRCKKITKKWKWSDRKSNE